MQSLYAYLPRLNPKVPACPRPMAYQALIDSARDFCTQSEVVREFVPAIKIKAGQASYKMDLHDCVEVVRVVRSWVAGRPLQLTLAVDLAEHAMYHAGGSSGHPCLAYTIRRNTLTLFPTPDKNTEGAELSFLVSTRPTSSADVVHDALAFDYMEAVVGGAVARLASTPNMPFTNPDTAAMGASMFVAGVSAAKAERNRGGVQGSLTMRGPKFMSGR